MKNFTKLLCFLFITQLSFSQTTEDFETETIGGTTFSDNGQNFAIANGPGESTYDVETFASGGWSGTAPDNRFLDNSGAGGAGAPLNDGTSFTISTSDGADILVNSVYLFLSTRTLQVASSTLTITGRKDGATVYTIVKSTGFSSPVTFTPNNGFTLIDFSTEGGSDNSNTAVDELIFSTTGNGDYAAFDAMNWEAIACTDPGVPSVTASTNPICAGGSTTIDWAGTSAGDATNWVVYTGTCGGTQVASLPIGTTSYNTGALVSSTTFFVRGEDGAGCIDETTGSCGSILVTVNQLDDASFNYGAASYCQGATDPAPTVTLGGGIFSGTAGLNINAGTGVIDVSTSLPGLHIVTYLTTGPCPSSSNVNVTINALPTAAFTTLNDLCINAGTQNDLGGGTSTGGVYSGAGVSDDGNGMTYDFDPAAAGAGFHTITYTVGVAGCFDSASDFVEVFFLPTVMFTAPTDLCIDAGIQTGLTGGSPAGGIYSGLGVTDNGNDTYDFDPATAGVGTHTITYTYTNANGCTNSASDDIEVFALLTVMFTALNDVCVSAGVQNSLGGGTPTGGVYSGTGVTDNGNDTYDFDPAAAGIGTHTITYTYTNANGCTNSASDDVEVFGIPSAAFTAPNDLCVDAGVQNGQVGGTPTGGVYSGTGVADDGNGMTYTFDPAAAGVGTHTITYTVGVTGCVDSAIDDIEVFDLPVVSFTAPGNVCPSAAVLAGQGGGLPTGGVYSGTGVTDNGNDTYDFDPGAAGVGIHTITYSFTNANGCSNSASDNIEVGDAIAPTAVCQNINAYLDGTGSVTILSGDLDGGSTDNCGAVTFSATQTTFTCADLGANILNLAVIDLTGINVSFCNPTVTVLDTISPVITCPGNQNEVASANCDFTLPNYVISASATDNCTTTPTLSQTPIAGTVITANTTITMTSADANGNTSTCTFDVILDFSACVGAECSNAEVLAAMDPCGETSTVTGSTVGGTPQAEGTCTVSAGTGGAIWYTFTGDGGDWTASTLNPGSDYDTKLWVFEGTCGALNCVTGNDDFGGTAQSEVSFATTVGLIYYVVVGGYDSDEGNYELTFTNVETEAPVADAMMLSDLTGVCEIATLVDPTATDNCSAVTVTNNVTLPITTSSTIIWTYTDANGNFSTQTQEVVLTDLVAPTASNPADSTYECIGDAIIDVAVVTDEADNCTAPMTVTFVSDTVYGNGCMDTIARTYNVADGSGNNIDVVQMIYIQDLTAPTASNPLDLTVQCIGDVPAPSTGWVTDEADNCSAVPTVAFVSDVSDGLSCPETITRTFSVTDLCGNTMDVYQSIIIMDIDAPIADIAALPEVNSNCDVTPTTATATDNCDGVIDGVADVAFPITAVGTTIVTWTYTDVCGNILTQTQDVIITAIDVTTFMASDNITIVANNYLPGSGVTYQWIDCDTGAELPGETNHNYTPTYGSNFAVIITENGCSDTSACVASTVGINEIGIKTLVLYPNPTNGILNIDFEGEIKSIEVVDMLGRTISIPVSIIEKTVDGSSLTTGKYMIRITTGNDQTFVKEFVVRS